MPQKHNASERYTTACLPAYDALTTRSYSSMLTQQDHQILLMNKTQH